MCAVRCADMASHSLTKGSQMVRVPKHLYEAARERAEGEDLTVSQVVRRALAEHLETPLVPSGQHEGEIDGD